MIRDTMKCCSWSERILTVNFWFAAHNFISSFIINFKLVVLWELKLKIDLDLPSTLYFDNKYDNCIENKNYKPESGRSQITRMLIIWNCEVEKVKIHYVNAREKLIPIEEPKLGGDGNVVLWDIWYRQWGSVRPTKNQKT